MADPIWPGSLPIPLAQGYKAKDKPNQNRTAMESGPDRVQLISSSFMTDLGFSLVLTLEQVATLRDFYKNTIRVGTDWFLMPISTGGAAVDHRVRIKGGISWDPVDSSKWKATLQVETEERN